MCQMKAKRQLSEEDCFADDDTIKAQRGPKEALNYTGISAAHGGKTAAATCESSSISILMLFEACTHRRLHVITCEISLLY